MSLLTVYQHPKLVAKKANKSIAALKMLRKHGLKCEPVRDGRHVVIRSADRTFDFWPTTQRWRERDNGIAPGTLALHRSSKRSGKGIEQLLTEIGVNHG